VSDDDDLLHKVHKAAPLPTADVTETTSHCVVCGQMIRRVPGGQGPVWVHPDGAVAATNDREKLEARLAEVKFVGEWAEDIQRLGDAMVITLCPYLGLDPEDYRGTIPDLWRSSMAALRVESARIGMPIPERVQRG